MKCIVSGCSKHECAREREREETVVKCGEN